MQKDWLNELKEKYQAVISHVFILHGNTSDLQLLHQNGKVGMMEFSTRLNNAIKTSRKAAFTYDLSKGWSVSDDDRELAMNALNNTLESSSDLTQVDPALTDLSRHGPMRSNEVRRVPSAPSLPQMSAFGTQSEDKFDEAKMPHTAFELADQLIRKKVRASAEISEKGETLFSCGLILDYAESYLSADNWGKPEVDVLVTRLLQWARDRHVSSTGNFIVIVCRDNMTNLHPALLNLESKIEQIYLPYPDKEDRQIFMENYFHADSEDNVKLEDYGINPVELASQTAGMNFLMVEDLISRCINLEEKFDLQMVKTRKDEIVSAKFDDVIEIADPRFGFEAVGGLNHCVDYIKENVILPLKTGNTRRCPMGVLMTGPPGTGKSIMAEAIAHEAQVLFVTFRFSKVFSKWVGESERNLDKILYAVKSMAPAVVFMDEIDQSGHRRDGAASGDSGVSSRIFQRLLEFMSDAGNRGKVLFVAASNRPDLLDPAMKRAGRFDKRIPFLAPTRKQQAQIFEAIMHKMDLTWDKPRNGFPKKVLDICEGRVGADIEAIVSTAYELGDTNRPGSNTISSAEMLEAASYLRPSVSPSQLKEMTDLALADVSDIRLVPDHYRSEVCR